MQKNSHPSGRLTGIALLAANLLLITAVNALDSDTENAAPYGPDWPGAAPELVAPSVINTDGVEINLVFNKAMTELFFARIVEGRFTIFTARKSGEAWEQPRALTLFADGVHLEAVDMALSPDEKTLFFLGLLMEGDIQQVDIWASSRVETGWSLAEKLGDEINTPHAEFYPVLVADGSLYFVSDRPGGVGPTNLYRAQWNEATGFAPATAMGHPIDSEYGKGDTFVSPDEDYIIFSSSGRPGLGQSDLFITFRQSEDTWSEPVNMGPEINSAVTDFCPMVSPDGKWFSFSRRHGDSWQTTRDAEIYWMNMELIESLRP